MLHIQSYIETSNNVQVEVRPFYLENRSNPIATKHVYVYFITISNFSKQQIKLLKRHWEIKDSVGEEYEVDGDGVIGKKPIIKPGGEFEYNSSCILKSYSGVMKGYFLMENEEGKPLKVNIPRFLLRSYKLN